MREEIERLTRLLAERDDEYKKCQIEMQTAIDNLKSENRKLIKTEKKRSESENHFRALADYGQALMWTSGTDKKCNYFNQPWLTFTGRTLKQELGDGWIEGVHPDDLQNCVSTYVEAYDRREKFSMEYRLRHSSGEYRWILDDGAPRYNKDAVFLGYIGHCLDISYQKEVEKKLTKSEALWQTIIKSIPYIVALLDKDGKYIYLNRFADGLSMDDLKDKKYYDFLGADTKSKYQIAFEEAKNKLTVQPAEHTATGDNQVLKYYSTQFVPIIVSGKFDLMMVISHDITERKKSEESLIESERLLRESQKVAHLGSFVWNFESGGWSSSNILDEIFGIDKNYIRTFEGWINIIHPDWQKIMTDYVLNEVIGKRQRFDKEYQIIKKNDGKLLWVHGFAELDFDVTGQPVKLIGTVSDITARKLAEEALRTSEYEFRLLAESMPQIVWITRADGWNIYFNQQWVEYTGLSLEESYGNGWNKPFHPEDQQRAWDTWQNATNNNITYSIESRLRRADGAYKWHLIRGVPIFDEHGAILKWFGTCTEINELKLLEEAISMRTERLQNLHQIDQAILLALDSPEQVVQSAIIYLRELLQCQRSSVGIFDFEMKEVKIFAAAIEGKTKLGLGNIMNEDAYCGIDLLRKNKIEIVEDASTLNSPSSIIKLIQTEGILSFINVALVSELELYGVMNVGWDSPRTITKEEIEIAVEVANQITIAIEKARLLKQTKTYANELEQRVADRTIQLETANKELEAFSYSVSHDLRAPLRHIIGFAGLLKDTEKDQLNEISQHYLEVIVTSARKMGILIDDLLILSRTGRTEMRKSSINMNLLVEDALSEIRILNSEHKFICNIGSLPEIIGDYNLLRLVWINLLGNAVKYTRNREKAVISINCSEDQKEYIFSISDNGVGFDMQYASKLFGVFQRLHSIEEFEGTGIGLANVNRIILRHEGRTWAEAKVNQGATFYFTIPK